MQKYLQTMYSVHNLNRPFKMKNFCLLCLSKLSKVQIFGHFCEKFHSHNFFFGWDCLYLGHCTRHQKFFSFHISGPKAKCHQPDQCQRNRHYWHVPDVSNVSTALTRYRNSLSNHYTSKTRSIVAFIIKAHGCAIKRFDRYIHFNFQYFPNIMTMTSWVWIFDKFL